MTIEDIVSNVLNLYFNRKKPLQFNNKLDFSSHFVRNMKYNSLNPICISYDELYELSNEQKQIILILLHSICPIILDIDKYSQMIVKDLLKPYFLSNIAFLSRDQLYRDNKFLNFIEIIEFIETNHPNIKNVRKILNDKTLSEMLFDFNQPFALGSGPGSYLPLQSYDSLAMRFKGPFYYGLQDMTKDFLSFRNNDFSFIDLDNFSI
eukprot:TRINITY_DN4006_c0_g1_i1.p1 TRINITY_DN4006_c0_g1~~TRINITY_DN4006_c0_g1_i1.p1  ORF type:complete len:207 (+),score=53.87 TRINITY_DN4006_c0_g1_i1:35-655(+)